MATRIPWIDDAVVEWRAIEFDAIEGYDADGNAVKGAVIEFNCDPEWLARRLNTAAMLSDAPEVEIDHRTRSWEGWEHVEPGRYKLVEVADV